jgi:hypothetical protein
MTQKSFETKLAKGKLGEDIVRGLLERKGWIVYCPFTGGAHAFDMLATYQKEKAIALDVKAKSRMNKYPATGINVRHYEQYKRFSEKHSMPFWIVFVDEQTNEIYGETLQNLDVECIVEGIKYPFVLTTKYGQDIRLWAIEKMHKFGSIPETASAELKKHNTRNYDYKPTS